MTTLKQIIDDMQKRVTQIISP